MQERTVAAPKAKPLEITPPTLNELWESYSPRQGRI